MKQTDLRAIASRAVQTAQKSGATMSESYLLNSKELTIEVASGQVETMKLAEDRGIGIRVIKDGRIGFAYSSDLSDQAVDEMITQAMANSEKTTADEYNVLPKPGGNFPALDIFDPKIRQATVEAKIAMAKEIESIARGYDPRVKITETSAYSDAEYDVVIANSEGFCEGYQGAYCAAYAMLVAEENGDNQTGFGFQYDLKYANLNPQKIGEDAAKKAVQMLGAKTIATQRATIVLDPQVATSFLGVLAPAITAEAVQKGRSLFAGKVGQKVAAPGITLIDDGTMPNAIMSAPFDGEGVPTSKTVLIEQGELKGFLHNTYTAAKAGVQSTGNGMRGSFKGTPEVGVTNFYIAPGTVSRESLIKGIPSGLYITEVMGMHTANPISGDFSVGAAGIWIENGEFSYPVRGVALAGNILELLQSVEVVADDLTFMGSKGSPTIQIAKMSLSGS